MAIDWTKLPSLTALRAFDATARAKTFSGAARSLNVTHAAVAQQVTALESHLDTKLVERSPRGIRLTPEGRELAERLEGGFSAIAEAVRSLQHTTASRPVRVTTTTFFAEAVIFPKLSSFWRDHPETEISFTPSDQALDIVAEGYDLAIRAGKGAWPGLTVRPFLEGRTIACAAPSLVDDPSTNWEAVPWLIPNDSVWEVEALTQSGLDPATLPVIDVGNPALEVRAAEEGIGLVLESEIELRPRIAAGTLKIAPVDIAYISRYFIVTPPRDPRPLVRAFIDWRIAQA